MTNTEQRALPTDWGTLKAYMPAEPDDTTVTKFRAAIARLDDIIATTVAQIEEAERDVRALAAELVDLAVNPAAPLPPLTRLDTVIRTGLDHRLEVLRMARAIAATKHTRAEQTDPAVVQWRQRCREREHEWQQIMGEPDQERRFARLSEFATRYARS